MYINQFWLGVISTIICEILILSILICIATKKLKNKKEGKKI